MQPDRNPARSISSRGFRLLRASVRGAGAQGGPGPSWDPSGRSSRREPAQGGDRGGAGAQRTYLAQPALAEPRTPPSRARSSTANPPCWGARAAARTSASARARCLLLLVREVSEARGVGRATGARRRGRGRGGVFLLSPGVRPPPASRRPPPSPFSSQRPGSGCRAGKAPSEVRAEPRAKLEIAPRPPGAPPPAWAPPRVVAATAVARPGGDHSSGRLVPPGSSRTPRPRALCDSSRPAGGVFRGKRRWARSGGRGGGGWGLEAAPASRFPERAAPGCHLAPDRGTRAAPALVGRTPVSTGEKDEASPERAVATAGQEDASRIRAAGGAGPEKRRGLIQERLRGPWAAVSVELSQGLGRLVPASIPQFLGFCRKYLMTQAFL